MSLRAVLVILLTLLLAAGVGFLTGYVFKNRLNAVHKVTAAAGAIPSTTATEHVQKGSAKMLFVGDMFFDRYIRLMSRIHGEDNPFTCVDPLLHSVDMVVGNLEGPITEHPSISEGSVIGSADNYRFTFPSTTAALLLRHNVRAVDLGNNHIANFDYEGMRSTKHFLSSAGVGYFGGMLGDEAILEAEAGTLPMAFVSYNAFYGTTSEEVAKVIAAEKEAGKNVIVFAHWGNEYSTSTSAIRPIAQLFASSGASLIVGAHPHIVLPHEMIGTTPVYYSLGNFIFDQYWDDKVTHGLALEADISDGAVTIREHEVVLKRDGRTCIASSTPTALPN